MGDTKIFVNTDSSGGTDGSSNASGVAFPTLSSALSYVAATKSAGDKWTVVCSAPSGVLDSPNSLDCSGIATAAGGYLHIRPNRGNEGGTVPDQRHYGRWNAGRYRFGHKNGLSLNVPHVYMTGLQLFPVGNSNVPPSGPLMAADACRLERCLIYADPSYAGDGSSGANVGIFGAASTGSTVVCNNAVIGFGLATAYVPGLGIQMVSGKYLNNTVAACRRGAVWGGLFTGTNNLITGSALEDFVSGVWHYSTMDYNASSDASAPGSHNRTSQTFTFVDAAGIEYVLDAADVGALGFGTDVSVDDWTDVDGQPNGPSVDLAEQLRSGTWSIGAAEAAAGAGGGLLLLLESAFQASGWYR